MRTPLDRNVVRWRRLTAAWLGIAGFAAVAGEPDRVLLLHSFGRDTQPFSTFTTEFRGELSRKWGRPLDWVDVELQSARFNEQPLVEYLQALFREGRPDLAVPIGGPAVRFVRRHRELFPPPLPVLLASVDARHVQSEPPAVNEAVFAVWNDPRRILEGLLQVRPGTTRVLVVFGRSPLEQFWVQEVRREFVPFEPGIRFDWADGLSLGQICEAAATLPPEGAVFFGQLSLDAAGISHREDEVLAALNAATRVPVFGVHDYQLGLGILGGPLLPVRRLARETAAGAERLLRGEPPATLRPPPLHPGPPQYDWRQLRRWGIREDSLPGGSEVSLRQRGVWERHWGRITLAAAALTAQTLAILALLAHRRRRQHAEQSLAESGNRLQAILDTAVEAILTCDEEGRVESGNQAATALFGQTACRLPGTPLRQLVPDLAWPPPDQRADGSPEVPAKSSADFREAVARRADGTLLPIEIAFREVPVAGRPMIAAFVRDLSDRKAAEHAAREFGGRLIRAQEDERSRLARELHDDITQRLARLAIDAGRAATAAMPGAGVRVLQDVRDGLVQLGEDVHALSHRLHPAVLDDLGLPEALRVECELMARHHGIRVEVRLEVSDRIIPREPALCLFRVAQEALRNAERHADAHSMQVTLRLLDGGLQLGVMDDGKGFDPSSRHDSPNLGLASMRERVRLVGGELEIESAPGTGTVVFAWVPLDTATPPIP